MKAIVLEDRNKYLELHKKVFGTSENIRKPKNIYAGETDKGEIFGFVAGHWNFDGAFYIQYAGVLPEFRKKGYMRYIKVILFDNIEYLTVTENTNIVAMKTLLLMGFIPMGSRINKGKCFIEWFRGKHG